MMSSIYQRSTAAAEFAENIPTTSNEKKRYVVGNLLTSNQKPYSAFICPRGLMDKASVS